LALICAGQKDAKQASGSELKNIARQLQIQQTKKLIRLLLKNKQKQILLQMKQVFLMKM
jgi:hypothetical protein